MEGLLPGEHPGELNHLRPWLKLPTASVLAFFADYIYIYKTAMQHNKLRIL